MLVVGNVLLAAPAEGITGSRLIVVGNLYSAGLTFRSWSGNSNCVEEKVK